VRLGPYRVIRRLGAGGMAETFEAVRDGGGAPAPRVCIKRILPSYAGDPELLRLFAREARVAASLSHPNITRFVELGDDAGTPYLVMELVVGVDLRRVLRALGGPLPIGAALLVGLEVARALRHAHTRAGPLGVVTHRDVSPANILASVDGELKLTDFGISTGALEPRITRSGDLRGNLWYMAPERSKSALSIDPRGDVFSLGVVLYEALSGRHPSPQATGLGALFAAARGERCPIASLVPALAPELGLLVESMLAVSPNQRPDAAQVAETLGRYAAVDVHRAELARLVRTLAPGGASTDPVEREATLTVRELGADRAAALEDGERTLSILGAAPQARFEWAGHGAIPPRWSRYAVGPGIWVGASEALRRAATIDAVAHRRGGERA
jgi:serine/threonine-protein kinase